MSARYFHHLRDTLILLGCEVRFADLVEFPQDISEEDIDDLRRFNGKLIDQTKDKLVNINKIAIEVVR